MRNQHPEVPDSTADDSARLPEEERDEERVGRAEVRRQVLGLNHRQVKAAFKKAQCRLLESADGGQPVEGGRARAELEEWHRIARLLADQAGPYDPDTDAFLQGELAGQADREAGRIPRCRSDTARHPG